MKRSFFGLFSLLLCIQLCNAQYTIHGKVLNEQGWPLENVTVSLLQQPVAVTDSSGNYSFSSPSLKNTLAFSRIGYESRRITTQSDAVYTVTLSLSDILLPETVVNSFERNSSIINTPASVSVLSRTALERYGSASFIPAVNTIPGVKMDERSPGSYRLSIRGNLLRSTFGVRNVKVYWNGIPFTDANGNTYFNEIAFDNIGKIEILKGPSGSMYGAGTGGVVLLSSNNNNTPGKSVSLYSNAGSYGLFSAGAVYTDANEKMNSSVSLSHQQSDGYRHHTNTRKDAANISGTYFINDRHNLHVNLFYSDLYYQTPGALTAAEMLIDPKQSRPAAGPNKSAVDQQAALYLKTFYSGIANEYHFNSRWSNTTSLYVSNTKLKNPAIRNYERKTEQGIGVRTVTKYNSGFFTATFGGEYQYEFTNTATFGNNLGQVDTLQYHDEIDARTVTAFVQTDINLMRDLILNAGVSYNNFHYGFFRLGLPNSGKTSNDFTPQFIPRVSVLKKLRNVVSVYASVSKGYSPPSIDEVHAGDGIFNRNLNAERGMNYEAGLKTNLFQNKLAVQAAYYFFYLKNTIVSRRDAAGADYFVNAGKTKQNGFEIGASYLPLNNVTHFIRQLKLWSNYSNIHARFENYQQGTAKFDGNKLTGIPPNVFTGGVDLSTSIGLYTNLTYNYTDQIPVNDANTFYGDHYNLVYAKLGYKVNVTSYLNLDLFVSYDHSFNEPYSLGNDLNAAGNRFFNPSSPQNFYGGLKLKVGFWQ